MINFLTFVKFLSVIAAWSWGVIQSRKPVPSSPYVWTIAAAIGTPYYFLYYMLEVQTPQSQNPLFLGALLTCFMLALGWTVDFFRLRKVSGKSAAGDSPSNANLVGLPNTPRSKSNDDTSLYAEIAKEIETGKFNKALWLKARVESNGDINLAEIAYTKLRYKELSNPGLKPANNVKASGLMREQETGDHLRASNTQQCPNCQHLNRTEKSLHKSVVCEVCGYSWETIEATSGSKGGNTNRSSKTEKPDQITTSNSHSAKMSTASTDKEVDAAHPTPVGGERPASLVYQLHLIHCHDFGFTVDGEHFDSVREALESIDAKTFRPRTVVDKDRANIIEKLLDDSPWLKNRRPLEISALKSELKSLGYLVFELPERRFRIEYRSIVVPAGDSISDLRAVLESHDWRKMNYKSI